jgi:hypothetical protein
MSALRYLCLTRTGWRVRLQGGILPPVWVYHELAKDEAQPDFKKHTRGYLLHQTEPVEAMTEEQAIEYLIMKDCPKSVWQTWNEGNKRKDGDMPQRSASSNPRVAQRMEDFRRISHRS